MHLAETKRQTEEWEGFIVGKSRDSEMPRLEAFGNEEAVGGLTRSGHSM